MSIKQNRPYSKLQKRYARYDIDEEKEEERLQRNYMKKQAIYDRRVMAGKKASETKAKDRRLGIEERKRIEEEESKHDNESQLENDLVQAIVKPDVEEIKRLKTLVSAEGRKRAIKDMQLKFWREMN